MEENKIMTKPIEGWEDYEVDTEGNVWSLKKGRKKLKSIYKCSGTNKYISKVTLTKGSEIGHYYVHTLVAEAFIPNPEHKRCVAHIDGNPLNNKVENLKWIEYKEYSPWRNFSKLRSRAVGKFTKEGELVEIYESLTVAAKESNTTVRAISNVCRHVYGFKSAGGYVWKYME